VIGVTFAAALAPLARRVLSGRRGGNQPMTAIARPVPAAEPPRTTLAHLFSVLAELTDDENEIVATMLHMVERGSVRLILA
jgi:hypothetical protein